MSSHPSLRAKFVGPERLNPREVMPPYDPCWCGGPAKFKFCHHRRTEAQPINIFEVDAQIRREFERGYCSHPAASTETCRGGITKAHTVQRQGGLAAIAEEGHVLTVKPTMKAMIDSEGAPGPRLIGIGKASVFPGFCGFHDSETFKAVEGKSLQLAPMTAFLLSYRAIAYEAFAKEVHLRSIEVQREMDRGQPFWKQRLIQEQVHRWAWGAQRGARDVRNWKRSYDAALSSGDFEPFHFRIVKFDGLLPIVACGAFHVEADLRGNLLQRITRGDGPFDHIAMTVTAFGGRTVAVLGWVGPADGPAADFAASFDALADDRVADAVVRIAFEQLDNIFIRPSWWRDLPDGDRGRLTAHSHSGSGAGRDADCLVDRGTSYTSVGLAARLGGEASDAPQ